MNPNDPANTPPATGPTPDATPTPEAPADLTAPIQDTPVVEETPTYDAPAEPTAPASFGAPVSSEPFGAPTSENLTSETPAPDATPAAAGVPGAVFAASSVGGPAPEAPNKKKLLVLAGIIGGVILLAVVGVIVYLMLTTVSREDYTAALKQYNEVSRASSQLESRALSLSSSTARADADDDYKESLAEMKEAVATIKTENEELSKLKAVRVGEGAEHYKVFNDKVKGYLEYADGLVASIEVIRPALLTCNDVSKSSSSDTSAAVAAIRSCATALGDAKDVPNESFKTYIGVLNESYVSLADIYEKVAAITNPYGAQYEEYKALRDQLYDVQDKISDASTEFREAMNESDEKYSPKESAKVLGEFLQEKQNA